jgi:ribosomal protein S18 acetylase RimI-like enzyme
VSLEIRDMAEAEAPGVAAMVQGLADHVGLPITTGLTAEKLNAARDLIDVTVAAEDGRLLGACLALMTYSTWRGERGLYIVDLFVEPVARNRSVGLKLLHKAAAKGVARGACFIKLEVDITNEGASRFYGRLGFHRKDADRLFFLEQDALQSFITGEDEP